jgi:DNA-binding NarL/FixJ family response regulator
MAQKDQTQMSHYKTGIQPMAKLARSARSNGVNPSSKKAFKVALVDGQASVRANWSKLIASFPDFACVWACSTGEEALRKFLQHQPDVVLVDVFLPRMSGIECTWRLKALLPRTQIVMLTAVEDTEWVFRALKAGADGYLLKRTAPADLRMALLEVLRGGAPLSNLIARRVIASIQKKAKLRELSPLFTFREEQVLRLLTQGHSNKLIARKLALSIDTVCGHLKKVFTKLKVSSRTQAAIRYMAFKTAPESRCLP